MTEIHGFIKPSRRPGELGIHSLDQFHFVVPDLAVARHFYSEFGLDVQEKGAVLTVNTQGHPHQWGTIGEGSRKKHGYMSFGAFELDLMQEILASPRTAVNKNKRSVKGRLMTPHVEEGEGD